MKKSLPGSFIILFFIAIVATVTGCSKGADSGNALALVPQIGTNAIISQANSTSAISGGVLLTKEVLTANGVCWSSTNQTPTIADSKTTDSIKARFSSKLTGLTPNTVYYVRAYATNAAGTGYGGVIKFTTTATAGMPTGTVTTIAGSTGNAGYADGTGSGVLFNGPQSIAYNANSGLLYVGDSFNNLIRTVTPAGITRTLTNATLGYLDGTLANAQFYGPRGMCFDATGNAFVADMGNSTIRKISTTGNVTTYSGNGVGGYADGTGTTVKFNNPQSIVLDGSGNMFVADRNNNLIRKITPAGVVSTFAGFPASNGYPQPLAPGFLDGTSTAAFFNYPAAIAIDASGNIYVADFKNNAIRKITSAGVVTTLAGGLNFPDLIGSPTGITVDATGNVFVVDSSGRVFEITATNILYLIAGAQNTTGSADGVGAAARFNGPQSITVDPSGNLYVADSNNNTIRKIVITIQ